MREVFLHPQMPTIGRIVHYTNLGDAEGRYPPEQQAAIITRVHGWATLPENPNPVEKPNNVSLCILYPTGVFFMQDVPYSETYEREHWTWPPRT